jgi:RNA polymerase sigma factor (sigma-70 family)
MVALPRLAELREREGHCTPVLLKFLSTTLLNRVNSLITKHLRGARGMRLSLAGGSGPGDPMERFPAQLTSAFTIARRHETQEALRTVLEGLSSQDREILVLRGIEQVSNGETGRLLGLSPSAVTMRFQRALGRLREQLPGSILEELVPA